MRAIKKLFVRWAVSGLLFLNKKIEALAEADFPKFCNNPKNVRIERPRHIFDAHRIHIGDDVSIGPGRCSFRGLSRYQHVRERDFFRVSIDA